MNIAELLKDCPKGTKLYSPIFGDVYLEKIRPHLSIVVTIDKEQGDFKEEFLYDGRYGMNGEYMLFPSKENRDWNTFQRPFKDGDILAYTSSSYTTVFIYRNKDNEPKYTTSFYVGYTIGGSYCNFHIYNKHTLIALNGNCVTRLATEEEKQKLFDAIKTNGYKWNVETKTLKKISPFKAGDVLVSEVGNIVLLSHIDNEQIVWYHCIIDTLGHFKTVETPICGIGKVSNCTLASKFQIKRLFDRLRDSGYRWNPQTNKLVVPKFKVGDMIVHKNSPNGIINEVTRINEDGSLNVDNYSWVISYELQDDYKLVPSKFDITTLKPFDKVLTRNYDNKWGINIFSFYDNINNPKYPFICINYNKYNQCIPYEGNEHLLGTTNDCDEYYKNW